MNNRSWNQELIETIYRRIVSRREMDEELRNITVIDIVLLRRCERMVSMIRTSRIKKHGKNHCCVVVSVWLVWLIDRWIKYK